MEQFPPNSDRSRTREPKQIKRVTSDGAVRRRRQPLGKQFRQTFFNGDSRMALEYMIVNTVVPAAKDMILEGINAAVEYRLYGERRRSRRSPAAGPMGYVAYNRFQPQNEPRTQATTQLSRPSRMRHAFDEIVISSRQEAEEVLDRLYDIIDTHNEVSVADLYELTGLESSHVDKKWGWEDLRGSGVGRVRGGGYLLELPEPKPLA